MSLRDEEGRFKPSDPEINWDSPFLSYIAGVLLGDGYICENRGTIGLHAKDKSFIDSFRNALEKLGLKPAVCRDGVYYQCRCNCQKFVESMRNTNLKEIPKNKEEKKLFIRGFFDSEGNLSFSRTPKGCETVHLRMLNNDKGLLMFVSGLIKDLGIRANVSVNNRKRENTQYKVAIRDRKEAKSFLEKIEPNIERRSIKSFKRHQNSLEVRQKWTNKEKKFLVDNYSDLGGRSSQFLPRRTRKAVYLKANEMGLKKGGT